VYFILQYTIQCAVVNTCATCDDLVQWGDTILFLPETRSVSEANCDSFITQN